MKKILTLSLAVLMTVSEALPVLTVAAVTAAVLAPVESQALPRDRMAGRQGARSARRTGHYGGYSRQAGRQVSRVRRRGYYGLPGGAVAFRHGGYSYYRVGGRYLYPYMYGGRTVYIDVDVSGGYPAPPPPVGSIDIDIDR